MKEGIIESIGRKLGIPDIAGLLARRLSGSELSSLLLEVFHKRTDALTPALLLRQYRANRFVHPASTDMIALLRLELKVLELLEQKAFHPIELSPASQLGTCSVVAPADQKKIISAVRNTEITADATNSLALHIADLKQSAQRGGSEATDSGGDQTNGANGSNSPTDGADTIVADAAGAVDWLRFCTIHRHIRTQEFKGKGFTPHFKVGCLVTAGRDAGSCGFECESLQEHFLALDQLFREVFGVEQIRFRLLRREGYDSRNLLLERVTGHLQHHCGALDISTDDALSPNSYYKGLQFKLIIEMPQGPLEIADGGFADWTQQLLGDRKERLLISGFGLSLMQQLREGSECS